MKGDRNDDGVGRGEEATTMIGVIYGCIRRIKYEGRRNDGRFGRHGLSKKVLMAPWLVYV